MVNAGHLRRRRRGDHVPPGAPRPRSPWTARWRRAGFEFFFHGRAAHAAGAPEEGINALDAVVQFYNAVSMLRQQVRSDVRIHGIILSGGAAANIIPDYAADPLSHARGRLRVPGRGRRAGRRLRRGRGEGHRLPARMERVHAAATRTRCPTSVLLDLMRDNLRALGLDVQQRAARATARGSTDFGNVTRRVPGIEARIAITEQSTCPATPSSFAKPPAAEHGAPGHAAAAKSLAMTAIDLLGRPSPPRSAPGSRSTRTFGSREASAQRATLRRLRRAGLALEEGDDVVDRHGPRAGVGLAVTAPRCGVRTTFARS